MKIKRIYIRNINSLRGEHVIDFSQSPFSETGLFAIIGATGAGKSTILDAITLALFNRIPRLDQISKNVIETTGSILTRGEKECAAAVTYACASGEFTSKWSIGYNKKNNLNDYEMELSNTETTEIVPLKKSQIPSKNQENIGLTYDQFIKSILLSQGEFAKFIKSNRNERGKLLEDITGTGIYRKIGKTIYDKTKDLVNRRNEYKQELELLEAQLLKMEEEESHTKRLGELTTFIQQKEEALKIIQEKINVKQEIERIQRRLNKYQNDLNVATLEKKAFEQEYAPILNRHEKAEKFIEKINNLRALEGQLSQILSNKTAEEQRLQEGQASRNQAIEQAKKLLKLEILSEEEIPDRIQKLKIAYDTLKAQKVESDGQIAVFQTQLGGLLPQLRKFVPNFSSKTVGNTELEVLRQKLEELKKERNDLLIQLGLENTDTLNSEKDRYNNLLLTYTNLKNYVGSFFEIAKKLKDSEKSKGENQQNWTTAKHEKAEKEKELTAIRAEIQRLEQQKTALADSYNFEKTRHELLHKDKPCPLCGSLEHPYLSHYANNYLEVDQNLVAKRQKETEISDLLRKANTAIDVCEQNIKKIDDASLNYTNEKNGIEKNIQELKLSLEIDTIGNIQTIDDKIAEINQKTSLLNRLIEGVNLLTNVDSGYRISASINELQQKSQTLAVQMHDLYEGNDLDGAIGRLQQAFTQSHTIIATCQGNLVLIVEQLAVQQQLCTENLKTFEEEVKIEGFLGRSDCESALLGVEQARQIREKKTHIFNTLTTNTQLIDVENNHLQENTKKDEPTISLLDLQNTNQDLNEQKAQANQEKGGIETSLAINNQRKEQIAERKNRLEQFDKDNRKWVLLQEYIGSADGTKYANFAQAMTLTQLVVHGNRRLIKLTDRYLLDKPTEKEDELMVIDQYLGNERRSVKTLSGGETFLISLSLALALSDMASRNVPLESLFIDEGFGTLDPETLDMALGTLEHLQMEGNKNIGIISHVEAIKERINTQIRLEKNNRGFSTLHIKG